MRQRRRRSKTPSQFRNKQERRTERRTSSILHNRETRRIPTNQRRRKRGKRDRGGTRLDKDQTRNGIPVRTPLSQPCFWGRSSQGPENSRTRPNKARI